MKTAQLPPVRVDPSLKQALEVMAANAGRSISDLIRVLLCDAVKQAGK